METENICRAFTVFLFMLMFSVMAMSQTGLIGTWKYTDPSGQMVMEIKNQTLFINGQEFQYSAADNVLYIKEGYVTTQYPYSFNGEHLNLEFPGGMQLTFTRTGTWEQEIDPLKRSMKNPSGSSDNHGSNGALAGKWIFQNQQGQLILEFLSGSQLSFNGEITQYRLQNGIIQALGDYGYIDYPYILNQGLLSITFPDGSVIPFSQVSKDLKVDNSPAQGRISSDGNLNWQLRGALCSWSGSSNDYSSYSRTQKIVFDGEGNFSFGSEASFSGDAGLAHSGNQGGERGTYQVGPNMVILSFQSGETYQVQIHVRQNSGMITELMHQGTLYAAGLCE